MYVIDNVAAARVLGKPAVQCDSDVLGPVGMLDLEGQRLEEAGVVPTLPLDFQCQLQALGTCEDEMLHDHIAAYATLVVRQPILVVQVASDSQNFPVNVMSCGDVTEALSLLGCGWTRSQSS